MKAPLCIALLLFVAHGCLAGQLSPEQWRADLAQLDQAIRRDHKNPFHTVSEADFAAMVQALHERIPQLSDQEIIVEMAAIVASVRDGHTRLVGWTRNPDWGFRSYPLSFYWFEDGMFVRQVHPSQSELLGARLVQIGSTPVEAACAQVARVAAADNAYGERFGVAMLLNSPELLAALGLIAADEPAPFLLEKDGRSWRPQLTTLEQDWPGWHVGFVPDSFGWLDAKDLQGAPTPLWRRHVDRPFWFEWLPESKTLYVQQNQVRDGRDETLESFWARVWTEFQSRDVEKLVLDLRLNGGGNNYLNKPALTTMVRADPSAQTFTIIGRQTFSACQNLVNELSRWSDTVFVGEPTSERMNFYGDTRDTQLEHSGLEVRASYLWWQNMDPRNTEDAKYPDLSTPLSFEDYARGTDPALQTILKRGGLVRARDMLPLLDREGREAALQTLRTAIHDPVYRHRNLEAEINQLGYELLGARRIDDAIAVFQLNTEQFPQSWNAFDSLGDALEAAGQLRQALASFERSLALRPDSPTGLAAVERLRTQLGSDSQIEEP